MKRKIISAILLLLLSPALRAGAIKAMFGPNWSKYLFPQEIDFLTREQKSGAGIGLGWVFSFNAKMKLEVNALYKEGGAKTELEYSPGKTIPGFYQNTAIAFPFLFKYYLKEGASPYAALGPELVFILSHHLRVPASGDRYNLSASTKKFLPGFAFLLGYEYPIGQWSLFVEVRYDRWLGNFLRDSVISVQSESVSILLGGAYSL